MSADLEQLIEAWDGLAVVARHDSATQSWIFVAMHDDTLGRPVGGTRMRVYPAPADGLQDAMRLAEGMTHKWAITGLPVGGGKAVLALSRPLSPEERTGLLQRYGQLLNTLRGSFATGEDLGTTPSDMELLADETRHVHVGSGIPRDPGPFTAAGVLAGIEAAVRHSLDGDLAGRSVLIQGAGDVGTPLALRLQEARAEILVADLDPERARRLAEATGGRVVPADDVYRTECDVYAPCAIGATLNRETIPTLRCRIVAGSANNQLAETADADRLHERGILYAPDYVINAGGALACGLAARGEHDESVLFERVHSLGETLSQIFAEAAERAESPLQVTRRRVDRLLKKRRD